MTLVGVSFISCKKAEEGVIPAEEEAEEAVSAEETAPVEEETAKESITLNLLMEDIPETYFIKELLPEFEEATGIKVVFEIVQYGDMHTKLVTQFMSSSGQYDVIKVDNYWAGEFPAAGWIIPIDEYLERDNFDISNYIPSMLDMVGYYPRSGSDKLLYMIPMYNYTMALIYRTDIINDPELNSVYKELYNTELKLPETLDEYVQICKFIQNNTEVYGSAMQAARGDAIVMEWSNYLFAIGGDYYNDNWDAIINDSKAIKAIDLYLDNVKNGAPPGATSYNLDDSLRTMQQGEAFSMVTYNWMLAQLEDPEQSKVVGKVAIAPIPGDKGLAGGWGWAIAHNTLHKNEAWEFIKWVESFDIAKTRALMGGAPARADVLTDPEVLDKYPFYEIIQEILIRSKPVPEFQYSTEMVEIVGRELSLIASEEKSSQEGMDEAAKQLEELVKKANLK